MDSRFIPNQQPYEQNTPSYSPNPNLDDPYGLSPTAPSSNPNLYSPYGLPPNAPNQDIPYPPPPPPPPSPPDHRISDRRTLFLLPIILLILVASGLALFLPYQNSQREKASTTATAQTRATNVARVATGTAFASNATATTFAASNASATADAQTQAAATATFVTQNANPYPPHTGTLVLSDPLVDNSQGNSWPDGFDQGGSGCTFRDGAYHAVESAKGYIQDCAINTFSNFVFQARMTILRGDCGVLAFRNENNSYYAFSVCQNGSYYLNIIGSNGKQLIGNSSAAIKTGLNQSNVAAVVAKGSSIVLYVNGHIVGSVNDNTLSSGAIGFGANAPFTGFTEVAYNDTKVWTL